MYQKNPEIISKIELNVVTIVIINPQIDFMISIIISVDGDQQV